MSSGCSILTDVMPFHNQLTISLLFPHGTGLPQFWKALHPYRQVTGIGDCMIVEKVAYQ